MSKLAKTKPIFDKYHPLIDPVHIQDEDTSSSEESTCEEEPSYFSDVVDVDISTSSSLSDDDLYVIDSEDDFWSVIGSFDWEDGTNQTSQPHLQRLRQTYTEESYNYFLEHFRNVIENMDQAIQKANIYDNMVRELSTEERVGLLSHIIARGREFYYQILANPDFIPYLIGHTSEDDEFVPFLIE